MENDYLTILLDLRYKMTEVLQALERREKVTVLYHGKVRGTIVPVEQNEMGKVAEHPFFGMSSGNDRSVEELMDELRSGRINAL